jgi:hypothetical protein
VVADRGFLMVNLWWNAGERWSENDLNSPRKICHIFRFIFWAFPFWENGSGVGDSEASDFPYGG